MPSRPPIRAGRRPVALAIAAALASGCLPSTWVAHRAPPPPEVAREEEARSAATPLPAAPAPTAPPAAPPTPPAPRSLADVLDLALSRDPSTRAAWYDARAAAAQAGSARTAWLPDVDASLLLSRQRTGTTVNGRPDSKQTTLTPSATLTWLLVDLGARGALIDAADYAAAAARLAEVSAVAGLVLSVQQSYFGYLGARALVDAETATVTQAETSLRAAEARQRAGLATIADVLQARTALSQARLTLQQYQGQALAVRGALATLAGLPPTAELDVGTLPADLSTEAAQSAIDALLAAAQARNPDVGSARATAEAAEARARAASRAVWPTLSVQATVLEPFYYATTSPTPPPGDIASSPGWIFGVSLRLPLGGLGVKAAYDVLAARAAADAARARADATSQRVALDVWTGYQGVRTAADRIVTSRDLLQAARANADVAQGRYREGVGSILDLLNAQAALELAQAESIRARADYLVSLAQLARASGRLDASARGAAAVAPQPPPPAKGGAPAP